MPDPGSVLIGASGADLPLGGSDDDKQCVSEQLRALTFYLYVCLVKGALCDFF